MKKFKRLICFLIITVIIGYSVAKLVMINSIKDIQSSGNYENIPVYKIAEIPESNSDFTFQKHSFIMPDFIEYNESDCTITEMQAYVCKDTEGKIYFAVMNGSEEKEATLQLYALNLALLNIDYNDYSFLTSFNKLERVKQLSLLRKIVAVANPRFITNGSRNVLVAELANRTNEYAIDVYDASTIIFKSDHKLSDEELLSFIKTMKITDAYITSKIGPIKEGLFDVNDSYKLLEKAYGTSDFEELFTVYESN